MCPVIYEEVQWDGECGKSGLELLKLELGVKGWHGSPSWRSALLPGTEKKGMTSLSI